MENLIKVLEEINLLIEERKISPNSILLNLKKIKKILKTKKMNDLVKFLDNILDCSFNEEKQLITPSAKIIEQIQLLITYMKDVK
jgi:hypothetical protein